MEASTQQAFDRLERLKEKIVQEIQLISIERYMATTGDKWSIAQIITHIITSEQMALSYMKKKSLGIASLNNSGLVEDVKILLLKISQRGPFSYRAPRAIVERTPPAIPFTASLQAWSATRAELGTFLETIPAQYIRRKIFKHPIAGMLNASQGVTFLHEHLRHHKPQIDRLLPKGS